MKKAVLNFVACLALVATSVSAYGWCYCFMFQEELPEEAKQVIRGKRK